MTDTANKTEIVDPYKDNPMLGQIKTLEADLKAAQDNRDYYARESDKWHEKWRNINGEWEQKFKEARAMSGFMKFLSGIAMVLWLLVVMVCLLVPPYAVLRYHISEQFLWFIALGLVLGCLWFVTAYEMRKET